MATGARAIWTGSIGFGMVMIPIRLLTAASEKDIRFSRFHKASGTKPRQVQLVNGKETTLDEMCQAYEVSKGHYVLVEKGDIEALAPPNDRHMQVIEFVPAASIDPIFYQKTYFLEPDKGGDVPYNLFTAALKAEGGVAIMKCFMKTKEHLAAVGVNPDGALTLSILYYEDEINRQNAVVAEAVDEKQLAMARMLVASDMSERYDPTAYKDEQRERIISLIEKLAEGQKLTAPTSITKNMPIPDIMDSLIASLDKAKKKAKAVKAA